ncbi:MAG: tyrosine-protein phosphatase [Bacteroidales bacterium]|nr:tyrosine-protein phosphatase [Bacteroidales bacterium]
MRTIILAGIMLLSATIMQAQRGTITNREVALEGAVNFRDLGGYTTTASRRVALNKIYRAAHLSRLTSRDREEMERRKIHTVLDLRSERDTVGASDRLPFGVDYLLLPSNVCDSVLLTDDRAMSKLYADISYFKAIFRPFFKKMLLLPDTSAIVFHCSTGKDRTGIAAALLLYMLDVPKETIFADYMATCFYLQRHREQIIAEMTEKYGIQPQAIAGKMECNPQYLQTVFDVIAREYGSVDAFLAIEAGIGEYERFMLREKFIE